MLGWEFPPHISGGLGTACHGLVQGLLHHGVEVLFVVPRAFGDELGGGARVMGANQVTVSTFREELLAPDGALAEAAALPGAKERAESDGSAADAEKESAGAGGDREFGAESARLREIAIDSLLRPYLTEDSYRAARGAGAGAGAGAGIPGAAGAGGAAGFGPVPFSIAEWIDRIRAIAVQARRGRPRRRAGRASRAASAANAATASEVRGPLHFSGTYGPGLMEEVERYALAVAELARHEPFDVVHAHDWMTFPAAAAAARVAGKPLVIHFHACEYDRSGEHINVRVRDLEQLGLAAADRVVCVSHYTAGVLRRRYRVDAARLRVVHNAVTQHEQKRDWHWEKAIENPIILFLGRITYQKGPDYFLDAAARVVKLRPDVKFVMGGSGDMLPWVVERAARLGLARNLHFTGFLRGSEVEHIYALADLYVMPSVSEPFGISPLEALALDVPVIVSRQSGVAEVLRNALKVDFWEVEDLANKILAVLQYPALRAQLTEEGREEIKRMRWEVRGALVRDIYRELVA
ncbi:MAG: glycosyltransferase family 4 protein [Planctomycetes bacterium]|nr:glycosyltransferase family 4 protein [Planctomycetota bacterium]